MGMGEKGGFLRRNDMEIEGKNLEQRNTFFVVFAYIYSFLTRTANIMLTFLRSSSSSSSSSMDPFLHADVRSSFNIFSSC